MIQAAVAVSRRSSRVPPCCRIGVARISQRCSRIGNEGGEAQLSLSLAAGRARITRKRRADGPPVPAACLPALRASPRDCRSKRAGLGGGTAAASPNCFPVAKYVHPAAAASAHARAPFSKANVAVAGEVQNIG